MMHTGCKVSVPHAIVAYGLSVPLSRAVVLMNSFLQFLSHLNILATSVASHVYWDLC